jgi:hypothetical protein
MSGPLDRDGHGPLVPGTGAEFAARFDLATLGDVAPEPPDVFVINFIDVIDTECADLAARPEPAAATAATPPERTISTVTVPPTRTSKSRPRLKASLRPAV